MQCLVFTDCSDTVKVTPLRNETIQEQLDGMGKNISSLMRLVAPDCKRMMLICRWHGEYKNCSDLFRSSKTDDGFCCSFNIVNLAEGFTKVDLDASSDADNYDYDGYDYYGSYDFGSALDYGVETSTQGSDVGSGEGSGGSDDYLDYQPADAGLEIGYESW